MKKETKTKWLKEREKTLDFFFLLFLIEGLIAFLCFVFFSSRTRTTKMMKTLFVVVVVALVAAIANGKEISKEPREVQERFVAAKLAEMTLADKVGQMTQGEAKFYTAKQAAELRLGSLLNGGGSPPPTGNRPENWADQYDEYQRAVLGATGVPLIYGQDAVHGINNVEGATVFPHNIGLGCAADAGLMAEMGAV